MPDEPDWQVATFEGNRRRQHKEFLALSFREKLRRIEQAEAVAGYFASRRTAGDPCSNDGIGPHEERPAEDEISSADANEADPG